MAVLRMGTNAVSSGRPLVWLSRLRTVIRFEAALSAARNHGM
jgi:hypothetical protein